MAIVSFEGRGGEGDDELYVGQTVFRVTVNLLLLFTNRAHIMPIMVIHAMTDSEMIIGHFTSSEIGVCTGWKACVTDILFLIKGVELVVVFSFVITGEWSVTELVVVFSFVITDEWSVTDSQLILFDWSLQTRGKRSL